MSSIFGFGKRELKENIFLEAIESIAESLKVLAEAKKCDCAIKQAQAEVGKPHGGPLS